MLKCCPKNGDFIKADCILIVENLSSPAGNRTPVSRVTGGDTYHYTTEDTSMLSHD